MSETNHTKIEILRDVIRSLSYWDIFILSISAAGFVGLVMGIVTFFPLFLERMTQEIILHNPESPIASIAEMSLWMFWSLVPFGIGVLWVAWLLSYLDHGRQKKHPGIDR